MVAKAFFVFCASALFMQSISASCIGYNPLGGVSASPLLPRPWAGRCTGVQPSAVASGGGLTVSTSSALAPTGVTIVSDNAIEGPLEVVGELPVLSAVTFEAQLPTGGAAGTTYSCGNGDVSISADSLAAAGVSAGNAGLIGTGLNGIGAGINRINGLNGVGACFNGIGAGISNTGLLNAGIANAELAAAGLNPGLAGAALGLPGYGGIY